MYTPCTSVEAIPDASIHHSALQNRDFGHTYDRSRALVRAIGYSSAGSSKIKIRTTSPYKAQLALYGDEVRILIFDDPAEL
jgi:hypothetical protein